jgi:anthranilate phosphoribosyltransferase
MQQFVKIVGRGEKLARHLSREEAAEAVIELLDGLGTPAQVGAFLVAMRVKSESAEECVGFTLGARERFEPPALAPGGSVDVGAPHDGRVRTAPLTWLAALVTAAGGVAAVASGTPRLPTKHGVGVHEVLESLGLEPLAAGAAGRETLSRLGLAYQPVERWFPRWEALRPVREELGLRTLLSTVEKLLNPCRADHAVVGIFHKTYLVRLGEALRHLGLQRAVVVQGPEGGVVPSVRRKTAIAWAGPEGVVEDSIDPAALGLSHPTEPTMPEEPSAITEAYTAVLEGGPGADPAWRDAACLAAGLNFALVQGLSVAEGARRARELVDSGEVARLWESYAALAGQSLSVPK